MLKVSLSHTHTGLSKWQIWNSHPDLRSPKLVLRPSNRLHPQTLVQAKPSPPHPTLALEQAGCDTESAMCVSRFSVPHLSSGASDPVILSHRRKDRVREASSMQNGRVF